MARIINLNRVRKAQAKVAGKTRADENAARFGRTKDEKRVETLKAERARRDLDGHERE